jgi:hypothetical protein
MKKKYELNVELKDIPTEDLVKMVYEVVGFEPDLEDVVFHENGFDYFNKFYDYPFSAVRDTCHSEYNIDDDYVRISHKAFSYTSEEVREKILSKCRVLFYAYSEWLAIGADLDYKHLFREVK